MLMLSLRLRQATTGTRLTPAQVDRLRSTVIKLAARVRVSTRRVLVELAAYVPFASEFRRIAHHLMQAQPWLLS